MATRIEWKPRGVLHAPAMKGPEGPERFLPEPPLDAYIEHFWSVAWDLGGQTPVTRETLPHPSVHLVIEAGRSGVGGVHRGRFTRTLEGRGRVFGIKFQPGCFRPFGGMSAAQMADRVLPLEEAFGSEGSRFEAAVLACGDDTAAAASASEAFLLERLPAPDSQAYAARDLVARIRDDARLVRVEAVAEAAGLSIRALQRLFQEYVGVSPKWVIQRYRLHEAMEKLDRDPALELARLALDLGYFDQAHFNRDFKALIGRTPSEYAKGLEKAAGRG